ncbi:vault protein inter-alpha-trypsin domain-containing protein [Jimgerdemannia flammicorona]|uniref:Vault protein inter-alpha-trypsin domain-containing protein n=1 Tax=Jimgerdemannia flammicorona TaxID=994334 RepID=A0A432ZYX2_9FUNG|nr:vault protein inter-alpha-trypsin domain-containing protein [Jimgerdemannia flammicorona]
MNNCIDFTIQWLDGSHHSISLDETDDIGHLLHIIDSWLFPNIHNPKDRDYVLRIGHNNILLNCSNENTTMNELGVTSAWVLIMELEDQYNTPNSTIAFSNSNTLIGILGMRELPLKNVFVDVLDKIAKVNLSQTYSNTGSSIIETTYKFPLPELAAINAFEVKFNNGRNVIGTVIEKGNSKQIYTNAVQSGHGAYLLEQKTTEIFEMKVGNIHPSEILTVHISYVQELSNDISSYDLIRFSLPTTIAPRYQADNTSTGVTYSSNALSYTLGVDVKCRMSGCILDISSESHDITANIDGKFANVTFANSYECLDKDFVLLVQAEDLDNPRAFIEYNPETDTNCVMLTMVPRFALTNVQSELFWIYGGSQDPTDI